MSKKFSFSLMVLCAALFSAATVFCQDGEGERRGRLMEMLRQRRQGGQSREDRSPVNGKVVEVQFEGRDRQYIVHVPPGYDRSKPRPLILVIHGGMGSGRHMQSQSRALDALADRDGVITVYPSGSSRRFKDKFLTWNTLLTDSYSDKEKIDDVGFLRKIIVDVSASYNVDKKRIFATGMSQGGMMSYRLACEAADTVAAVAPVAGALVTSNCHPSAHVSVMMFNGMNDQSVLYNGGPGPKHTIAAFDSAPKAAAYWARANGLGEKPGPGRKSGGAYSTEYGPGKDGTEVILWTHPGAHEWPGSQRHQGSDLDATELIWNFFKKHPKP